MPSPYAKWCRADPDDARRKNFAKALASPRYRRPRPFRSADESHLIRRFVFLWFTAAGDKPSARSWARQIGISRAWLLKLVREFRRDPGEMLRAQACEGDPRYADLVDARERSQEMRRNGELRPLQYQCWKLRRRQDREWRRQQREREEASEIPYPRAWKRRMRASRNAPK